MKSFQQDALRALNDHKVIAFPTETVYGLGIFYDDYEAYQYLNEIKERPEDKPYTMMLFDPEEISKYAYINPKYQKIIDTYMPGPLTILVKAKENVPNYVTHDTQIIGIRVPDNMEAYLVLLYVQKPLLVPSANKSGQKPAVTSSEVRAIFGKEVSTIIPGECKGGKPSTIVDLTGDEIKLIRKGPISLEELNLLVYN